MVWQGLGDLMNDFRTKTLGLDPVSTLWAPGATYRLHVPFTYLWSPGLVPKPEDWGSEIDIAGFVFLDLASSYKPPAALTKFLDAGEPPVYFGFGSIRAPEDLGQVVIKSARALGHRVIVSRGWADLSLVDNEPDCIAIGEVNQQALFKRVAAVVHHGGAGTTTAAARAGALQVVIPQMYDQSYWAQRVHHLGIGAAHAPGAPTTDSLTSALQHARKPDVAARAQTIAAAVRSDGAQAAARRLMAALQSST